MYCPCPISSAVRPTMYSKTGYSAFCIAVIAFLLAANTATAQNIERSPTYVEHDAKAERTVTDFGSVYATTHRATDDSLETRLLATTGEELASMSYTHSDRTLRIDETRGRGPRFEVPASLQVTSDWANAQLYSLWRDRTNGAPLGLLTTPVFDGFYLRPPGLAGGSQTAEEHRRSVSATIQRVRMEFTGVIAESVRNRTPEVDSRPGAVHSQFTTQLLDRTTQRRLGIMQWFPEVQTLSWKLDGETEGYVNPQRLAQAHMSGWPFQPELAWLNLQMHTFFLNHPLRQLGATTNRGNSFQPLDFAFGELSSSQCRNSQTSVGYRATIPSQLPTAPRRIYASNEVGCDVLSFFDGTFLEPCCHQHDACYGYDADANPVVPNPCGWKSWLFLEGWDCMKCNVEVLWCFFTGGTTADNDPFDQDDACDIEWGEFCSAECPSCY